MIQPMKKRRSGRAVLAVGALIASVLAAGAVPAGPAGAVTDRPDHSTRLSACVGDAAADRGFGDVSEGHAFRRAINCIAYYGITRGTAGGTAYSPEQDVTRAQMAVFIARAAEVAGVDLGPAGDARFGDIADIWQEGQDAINRLALKGMIPSGGSFRPDDAVTRAEMATFLIGLLLEAAPNVTRDSSGAILLGEPGLRSQPDDRFPDTAGVEVAAIYELGVTRGASAAGVQDPDEPPLDLNYEPDGTVNRGRMAAFITRALAHTSVRPAGVSAQYDGADVVVSVRDAQYRPVSGAVVDVFWAPADNAAAAVAPGNRCNLDAVTQADHSLLKCEIDETDPATGDDGEATVAILGLHRVPTGGAAVWAWTGGTIGDVPAADTDLYRLDVAEGAEAGFATSTLVTTTFNARKARFGATILYTVQLRDGEHDVEAGVNGIDPAQWNLTEQVPGQTPRVRLLESDPSGQVVFSISLPDPSPGVDGPDVTVSFSLATAANAPPLSETVGADGRGAATGMVTFSDDPASIASGNATVTIDAPRYVHVLGDFASSVATVTALDQYGQVFPGTRVSLSSSLSNVSPDGGATAVDGRGSSRISYTYSGAGGETGTLTVSHGVDTLSPSGAMATVHWAADAGPSDDDQARSVLTGDIRHRHIVARDADGPVLLEYDGNDRFNLSGNPVSLPVFESVLAEQLKLDTPTATLEWSSYRPGNPGRVTEYNLIS